MFSAKCIQTVILGSLTKGFKVKVFKDNIGQTLKYFVDERIIP